MITYSTTVSIDFDDLEPRTSSDEESMCTVSTRLNSILTRKLPHGYTATYDALVSVYKSLLNSRPTAKKAVLVITDGKSNIGPPPLKAAVDILSLRWQQTWDVQRLGPQVRQNTPVYSLTAGLVKNTLQKSQIIIVIII